MQGGMDRKWAKPLNPRARGAEAYGNWAGAGAGFNVLNLQPGFYYTCASDRDVDTKLLKGYEIVDTSKGHKERFVGYGRTHLRFGQVATTEMKLGPYYLVRIPLEKHQAIRAQARERRAQGLKVPTRMILGQNAQEAAAWRARGQQYVPRNGEVFYKDPEHAGETGYSVEEVEVTRGQR